MPWRWMTTALPILAGKVEDHTAKTVKLGRYMGKERQKDLGTETCRVWTERAFVIDQAWGYKIVL